MGKKQKLITSFNPNDFEVVEEPSVKPITQFDPSEFTVVSAPKQPTYIDTFTQVQNQQSEPKKPTPDEILSNVKTNNDSEKELLKNLALKVNEGKATHEELSDAILTIQGQHPKQEGQGSYFVENSDGVYIPRPLKKYELPKQKNVTKIFSDKSTIETFADSWERGKATLAESLVRTPEFLYDLAVNENINKIPNVYNPIVENYNKVAKKEGLKELPIMGTAPTSAQLGDITGIHNDIANSISQEKERLSRDYQQKYDKGITEYVHNGEYGKAIGLLSNSIIESAPTTVAIALSGGLGASGTAITLGGGAVFGAGKKAELDKESNLSETDKLGNAVVTGLAEGFFEQWGITKLGGIVSDIFKKEGKDAAKLFAEQAFKKTYGPAIGKYIGITAEEGLGEAATQFAQNAVDKYSGYKPNIKLSDGVADALIVGIGASTVAGGGVSRIESAAEKKIKKANEQSQYLFDTAKKGTDAIIAFKADIDNSVKTGQVSPEAAGKAKFQLDAYKEYHDQTADLDIPNEQKREIFDKTFQKSELEEHIKGLNPEKMNGIELAKYEGLKKQAKHLQEDINKIVLEAQIKGETIAGEKTIEEHEQEPVIKGKEEKKPILSPELQALKDRYKKPETVKEGKLPEQPKPEEDTRTLAEIPNDVYNHSQFNARTKHAKLAEYLETVPDKQTTGVLKENVYTYNKKKNRTYEVELPDGKRIRLASSMLRDTGISGHFRTEHIKGRIPEFPVGVKVEYLPDGKKAIKIFNGKTGKFLSWAKATNTGKKDEWTDLQKDQLEHLATTVEPPIVPPSEEVKPTEPTKPIAPTNVQQINEKTTTGEKSQPATTSKAVEEGERKAKALRVGTKKANRKIRHPEKIQALNHEVFDPHGLAMQYFIAGGELNPESVRKLFSGSKGEQNARISYIRKNGPTIEQIAENIVDNNPDLNLDLQDVVNAVEDVVMSHNSSTTMAKELNNQLSEGKDMRFNPLEEVINTEAEVADNNGNGEEFDRAIDFLEGLSDEELIKLANDQEAFNNWYEDKENKINDEGSNIIGDDGKPPQFQISSGQNKLLKYKTELPTSEEFKDAVKNTEGAEITENGLSIKAVRFQNEYQGGTEALRTGVFYLPYKDKNVKFYKGAKQGYGGNEKIEGEILIKKPMFVKGATGGKAPEIAYDLINGKGAYQKMRTDVLKVTTSFNRRIQPEDIAQVLTDYNKDSDYDDNYNIAYAMVENSKQGNALPYAVQENIVANSVRDNGYDSVLGYSKRKDGTHFISEIFDVRETHYPEQGKQGEVHPRFTSDFQKQKQDKGSVEVGSHEALLKVTQHIQKVLPKIKVIYNNKLKAAGKLTADGKTIEINPYYAGSDTPIHEAGHVLIDAMGYDHVAIQAGIRQLKKTDLYKETKQRYPELSEEMLNKEVLAEAIGREGADIFDSEVEKSKFRQVLEHIFNWFKQKLGLDKNIAKSLSKQIIGGIGTKKLGGIKGEEQNQIIGIKGAKQLDKAYESTERADNLFTAKQMSEKGVVPAKIKYATGWELTKDGWKYETSDKNARINNSISDYGERAREIGTNKLTTKVKNIITNFETLKAYPKVGEMEVVLQRFPDEKTLGGYNSNTNKIVLNLNTNFDAEETKKLLIHEIQHVVQKIEGFARGTSFEGVRNNLLRSLGIPSYEGLSAEKKEEIDKRAEKVYRRFAGEVEARNAEFRRNMTENELRQSLLSKTEDESEEQKIYDYKNKGTQESREPSEKTTEAIKAFDEVNSKRGINRNTAMKEFKKNFPNLAPTIKLINDNFKEIVNQLKQTHNLIEKC